jgi:UDP-N-acetylglucosamine 2-epimerase (non-hydrolysing)
MIPRRVAIVFGTRPEAIKLCPVVLAMRGGTRLVPHVCVTAQHREMLDQVLRVFEVEPDTDLDLMAPNQTLAGLTARVIARIDEYLAAEHPDLLMVQGDTTTTMCAAMAAFYRRIPVVHVEAGLRTGDFSAPFPEEMNRVLTTRFAAHHFAPTATARANLLKEGIAAERITVTGNTVIDALRIAVERNRRNPPAIPGLPSEATRAGRRLVLITGHRRESFGEGLESICAAIRDLAEAFPEVAFVYPVHLNPNVRGPVFRLLGNLQNVFQIEPLEYLPFVRLMELATLCLTDSGGVQEEAPSLAKPVLVMRTTTERPEVIEAGGAKLVGTVRERIFEEVTRLLTDPVAYAEMARGANPYGDGTAARQIVALCEQLLDRGGP